MWYTIFYSPQYSAHGMTHFLILLQIALEQLNNNRLVYTPLKGKIPEQEHEGSSNSPNGGDNVDFVTPLKESHKAGEEAREFSSDA